MDQYSISINDATDILRRRWPVAAAVALVVFLAAVVTTFTLENVYRSVGRVSVTEPEYPVGGIYPKPILPLEQRISDLTDAVLIRPNLKEAVERFALFPDERIDNSPGSVVGLVRQSLEIKLKRQETEAADRNLGKVVGFTLAVTYEDPRTARDVAGFFVEAKEARRKLLYADVIRDLKKEAVRNGAGVR